MFANSCITRCLINYFLVSFIMHYSSLAGHLGCLNRMRTACLLQKNFHTHFTQVPLAPFLIERWKLHNLMAPTQGVSLGIVFNMKASSPFQLLSSSVYPLFDVCVSSTSAMNSLHCYWTSLFKLSKECQFDIFLQAKTLSLPFHHELLWQAFSAQHLKRFSKDLTLSKWTPFEPASQFLQEPFCMTRLQTANTYRLYEVRCYIW